MKVGCWPFYSQQDKRSGQHLQRTCGAAKQLAFLATELQKRGVQVVAAVPWSAADSTPFTCSARIVNLPSSNPEQRIHWDVRELGAFFADCDVCVLNNEYHAIPLRTMFPEKRLIQMCSVKPDNELLFRAAWDAADLVVAQGEFAASCFRCVTKTPVSVWSLAYDDRDFQRPAVERDIDVCFVQRCSADNATHHKEFMDANGNWNVVYTDVTGWLKKQWPRLKYSTPETYIDTLFRSKVAVSLYDSLYGGLSIREAIRAGCVPVVMDVAGYRELVGPTWPFCVSDLSKLHDVIAAALLHFGPLPDVSGESYQNGVKRALEDVCRS